MRLCTFDLFERTSSSFALFVSGYEHIEVLEYLAEDGVQWMESSVQLYCWH